MSDVKPAVFLDRDGVLNRVLVRGGRPFAPVSLEEFDVPPDVPDALRRLKAAGFELIVVTNQPDVARGVLTRDVLDQMHAQLTATLPISEIRVCYHDDADNCQCRKPKPGLLLQAPRYAVTDSYMVGDRWRDVEAGRRANCRATILVGDGYGEQLTVAPDVRVDSVGKAVDWILSQSQSAGGK